MKDSGLSIMQPYIFPYIGYFHLIESTDRIVFYDDVSYIKQGWINRNRILSNGKPLTFTVPLSKASSFELINNTFINKGQYAIWKIKFLKTLRQSYSRAPFFEPVFILISSILDTDYQTISELAIGSIVSVYKFLDREIRYTTSSLCSPSTVEMDKADRIIRITKDMGYRAYVNPIGGLELYDKSYFQNKGVQLGFVQSREIAYRQFGEEFIPWLSVIDLLMFNSKTSIKEILSAYEIV